MTRREKFSAVQIGLESPEAIAKNSWGEVTKADTLNYRSLEPDKDGLFSQRIFGPTQNFVCGCGKYKKQRFQGIICERCGVEVTLKDVRRERMGHITLASPVAHIWFAHGRGTPSPMATILDIPSRDLENVVYFARWMVTSVDQTRRDRVLAQITTDTEAALAALAEESANLGTDLPADERKAIDAKISARKAELTASAEARKKDLAAVKPSRVLTDDEKLDLEQRYPGLFRCQMGAEAVLNVFKTMDLTVVEKELSDEVAALPKTSAKRKKMTRRLRLIRAMIRRGQRPEWMILTVLPVLPPDLRPMVQLDGGRFATSDLNDLYRRVINRNNRLKRLVELRAPELIITNEQRMLQEAVDTLIDNGKRGMPVKDKNHQMKSLADELKGKHGRFRGNLLGKRVDYSGRSVIVVGPQLKLNQCGLPKIMALELFKPMVMGHLTHVMKVTQTVKAAKRLIEAQDPIVWEALGEVIKGRPVLLNRAPTLHRLGIMAFEPVLIDGNAIQLHPLTCKAFNADFDGDQMPVHVPLSEAAVKEAYTRMLSTKNIFSPANGEPLASPTLEMIMGAYYLTQRWDDTTGAGGVYASIDDAELAYATNALALQAPVSIRFEDGTMRQTTLGRALFNRTLPAGADYIDRDIDKYVMSALVREIGERFGHEACAEMLDRIKDLTFRTATRSGATIAVSDIAIPAERTEILRAARAEHAEVIAAFKRGEIDAETRRERIQDIWTRATVAVRAAVKQAFDPRSAVAWMSSSGARGNLEQYGQMAGIRGLMTSPSGEVIETPITSNLREGHTVLEYFISMHGARKGQADTSLNTANSGYLTRRIVDVAQDVIVREEDCGTDDGRVLRAANLRSKTIFEAAWGRLAAADVLSADGTVLVRRGEEITRTVANSLEAAGVTQITVRSPLTCALNFGVCQKCYGTDLSHGGEIALGEAVGVVAAQSIGEPGTQLTLRTFHTGGVSGTGDVTQGIPRINEVIEARIPKVTAALAVEAGTVHLMQSADGRQAIEVVTPGHTEILGAVPKKVKVAEGDALAKGALWAPTKRTPVAGTFRIQGETALLDTDPISRVYPLLAGQKALVTTGDQVEQGQPLTTGFANPYEVLELRGVASVAEYLIEEMQLVYGAHASIHDKHVEIIVRQMLRRAQIEDAGDTDLLPGELVDRARLERKNAEVVAAGGVPATAKPILLGISRAAETSESFLSAASFQTTTQVLTNAAVRGAIDPLRGLKENVILGRLIPAGTGYEPAGSEDADTAIETAADLFGDDTAEPSLEIE